MANFFPVSRAGILLGCAFASTAFAAAPLYDNGPPSDPRIGWEMTHYLEADDFPVTEGARIDSIRFWDFELPYGFQGTFVWQIYSNDDTESPGRLIASGVSNNLSREATGVPAFGVYQDFANDFDVAPIYLPPGTYWLALHDAALESVAPAAQHMFWDDTDRTGLRASYAKMEPYSTGWFSNEYPGFASELAFQIKGVLAPRITACSVSRGLPQVSFTTTSGQSYRVVYKNNLSDAAWMVLPGATSIAGTGGVVEATDSDPNAKYLRSRFYRVEML